MHDLCKMKRMHLEPTTKTDELALAICDPGVPQLNAERLSQYWDRNT